MVVRLSTRRGIANTRSFEFDASGLLESRQLLASAALRRYRRSERLSPLSCRTDIREDNSPVVRRVRGRMDHLPGVLSKRSSARLSLCGCVYAALAPTAASSAAHRAARSEPSVIAAVAERVLEACAGRGSLMADPRPAHRRDRASLRFAQRDEPADPELVLTAAAQIRSVQALCVIEFRFSRGSAQLSVSHRTAQLDLPTIGGLVSGICSICGGLCVCGLEQPLVFLRAAVGA